MANEKNQGPENEINESFSKASEWLEKNQERKRELEALSIEELKNDATKIEIIKHRRTTDKNRQLDEHLAKRKPFVDYVKKENPSLKPEELQRLLYKKIDIVLKNEGIYITGKADNNPITDKDIEKFRIDNQKEIENLRKKGITRNDGTALETHMEFLDRMEAEGKLPAVVANFEMQKEKKQEKIDGYYQNWLIQHPADEKDLNEKTVDGLKDELTKHAIRNTRRACAFREQLEEYVKSSKGKIIADKVKKSHPGLEGKDYEKALEKELRQNKVYLRNNNYDKEITPEDIGAYRNEKDMDGRNLHVEKLNRLEEQGKEALVLEVAKIRKESADNYMSVKINRDAIEYLKENNPKALENIENKYKRQPEPFRTGNIVKEAKLQAAGSGKTR